MGLIFFTVLIQKSDKLGKVLSGCMKNFHSEIPEGNFFQKTSVDFPLFILNFCFSEIIRTKYPIW